MKKGSTKANLNIRSLPSTDGSRIAIIPRGTNIAIKEQRGDWYAIEAYVHKDYVEVESKPNEPTPPSVPQGTRLGYHIMAGQRDVDLIKHLERMANKGNPIAGLTILFVGGTNQDLPRLIKQVSPKSIILGRIYVAQEPDSVNGNPQNPLTWAKGDTWIKSLARQMENTYVDYWQIANEWGTLMPPFPNSKELEEVHTRMQVFSEFYIAAAETAKQYGRTITVGDFSVGHIENYAVPFLSNLFSYAEENGNPVNYHAYNGDGSTPISVPFGNGLPYYAGRFVNWSLFFPRLKFILGEAGAGDARYSNDKALEISRMRELDKFARGETPVQGGVYAKNVLFFAWWSLFPHNDWAHSNFKDVLPEIELTW